MTRRLFLALLALAAPEWGRSQAPEPPAEAPLGFETFHAGLAPYGSWDMVESYGVVWRPAGVAPDWRPYLDGWWVWTDDGWFWASEEPWAWATYHYGRWVYDPVDGWIWLPGYEWAPAWVAWQSSDDAVGWAPLYPGYTEWWTDDYPLQAGAWIFVPVTSFAGVPIATVCYPPHRAPDLLRRTRPAPPRSVLGRGVEAAPPRGGPPPAHVERSIGRPIPSRAAGAGSHARGRARRAARRTGPGLPAARPDGSAPGARHPSGSAGSCRTAGGLPSVRHPPSTAAPRRRRGAECVSMR